MNKILGVVVGCGLILAACGSKEDVAETPIAKEAKESALVQENKGDNEVIPVTAHVATEDPRLNEPDENTVCEMCNMKVYEKNHTMGMFSTQAIKADGSISFYDDIGCLLNAEVANNEKNEKFVRDFNTLKWAKVEDVTIVKTDLKTPMNWGYAYFLDENDAKTYIAENEGSYIEKLETIKEQAKAKYEQKMKQQGKMGDVHNH